MKVLKHKQSSLQQNQPKAEVIMLKGFGNYTWIYTLDGQKVLLAKTMHLLLNEHTFCKFWRVHKSYSVNPNYIQKFENGIEPRLILNNGLSVEISRRKKKEVLNLALLRAS